MTRPLTFICLVFTPSVFADDIKFVKDIRPILSDACYTCHGPDSESRATELRLDDRRSAISSGVFASGEMIKRLATDDPDLQMPPPDSSRELSMANRNRL